MSYTFSELKKGIHNLVGIFWDSEKEISAGSLDVAIDVQREALIEEKPIYDFELNDDEESYTVAGFSEDYINNYPTEITIPSEYQEKPVTRIGDNAFYGCEFVDIRGFFKTRND